MSVINLFARVRKSFSHRSLHLIGSFPCDSKVHLNKERSRENNIEERTMVLLERKGYLKPVVTRSDGMVKQDKE